MVVDDSAVIRGLMSKWLEEDPAIKIVGTAGNGKMALASMVRYDPEIIILDIEMPVMDGLTALPKFFEINPKVKVIMASTLTSRNAEISMRALSMGASDYVSKPTTNREVASSTSFQKEIISKVISIAAASRLRNNGEVFKGTVSLVDKQFTPAGQVNRSIEKRRFSTGKSSILAIGSSTGGPQALLEVLRDLGSVNIPIVITQHMPPTFTKILAKHLTSATNFDCKEAEDGDLLENGKVYLAPGDHHLTVVKKAGKKVIALNQDAPENFCRPSVEPMFRSLIDLYGGEVFAVILTGMGHDGLEASRKLVEAGGKLIAQDEKTSVVWGMPGAVCEAGLCSGIYPLNQIGSKIKEKLTGLA
ncbi:MAG: chemotaxis response regulator protein-glutamate methylesterase [Alphaproteobacteria bacterium]|nr:MAG: chemotaxis response regulator protein-glutamate methylesterase [Alphaproteobacteria bacterium]